MDILKEAFTKGKLLATIDGVEYRAVTIVCDKSSAGIMPFSTMDDWQTTPQALLARRDAEIAALTARIKELEGAKPTTSPHAYVCSICGKGDFTHYSGLAGHRFKKHGVKGAIA
jgi:hypothetical protein